MAVMNWKQSHGLLSGRRNALGTWIVVLAVSPFALSARNAGATSMAATNLPSCLPAADRGSAVVRGTDDHGVLILRDGRVVKPEGLLLPPIGNDKAGDAFRRDALAAMRTLLPGDTAPYATPKPLRQYDAVDLTISRRFSNNWFGSANLTISRLYGNYSGLANSDEITTPTTGTRPRPVCSTPSVTSCEGRTEDQNGRRLSAARHGIGA